MAGLSPFVIPWREANPELLPEDDADLDLPFVGSSSNSGSILRPG